MKKRILVGLILVIIIAFPIGLLMKNEKENREEPSNNPLNPNIIGEFNLDIVKQINNGNTSNYLISPYSIELAMHMVKSGASGKTYEEIIEALPDRNMPVFKAGKRISLANALFLKSIYENKVKKDFVTTLKQNYDAEVIIDEFNTPDKINEWVNKKTNEMIPSILDEVSPNFVLGLANALAIDAEWDSAFECIETRSEKFTNGNRITNVAMMHNTYKSNAKYIDTDKVKGVILPYAKYNASGEKVYEDTGETTNLEFIALMPKNNLENYVNSLKSCELNKMLDNSKEATSKKALKLSLPQFEYDYEVEDLKKVLTNLGIKRAFDDTKAEFGNIMDESTYIATAIHKTHISLNENGTKAAAVTYFGVDTMMAIEEPKYVNIEFNKPFLYIIRDTKTKEMLFFGSVYEPSKWSGSTCSKVDY